MCIVHAEHAYPNYGGLILLWYLAIYKTETRTLRQTQEYTVYNSVWHTHDCEHLFIHTCFGSLTANTLLPNAWIFICIQHLMRNKCRQRREMFSKGAERRVELVQQKSWRRKKIHAYTVAFFHRVLVVVDSSRKCWSISP